MPRLSHVGLFIILWCTLKTQWSSWETDGKTSIRYAGILIWNLFQTYTVHEETYVRE